MKHQLTTVALLIATALIFASCLKDDNDAVDYSFYNDTAVTAFSLGTLTKTSHTTASTGEDSTYTESFAGSAYKFYIDQENALIYNPDSLPYTTNVSSVLASITTKNSGLVYLKDLKETDDEEDTFSYYSTSDSIDFSQERTIRILALNGQTWRDYTVKVNVHQEAADSLFWQKTAELSELATATHMRLVSVGDKCYLLSSDGNNTQMWLNEDKGVTWSAVNIVLGADAWKNAVAMSDKLYLLDGTTLYVMDNSTVDNSTTTADLQQLIAASSTELYARSTDGMLVSKDNGNTWEPEPLDDNSALLPEENISFPCRNVKTNNELERVLIVGTNDNRENAVAWTKIVDTQDPTANNGWSFVDDAGDTRYAAPKWQGLTIINYDGKDIAFGQNTDGSMNTPLQSLDGGITWKSYSDVCLPEEMADGAPFAITVDNSNYLWFVDHAGQVWRGRINRLGWSEEQKIF